MNISSIVVRTPPDRIEAVAEALEARGLCEVFFRDPSGKLIAIIEAESTEAEVEALKAIQATPDVLSAELVFTYSEAELEAARAYLEEAQDVPEILNDENARAEEIRYGGDVRHKL